MITVFGGSKSQKKYVASLAQFCVDKFMPRIKDVVEIRIHLKDLTKQHAYGFCTSDPDDESERSDRPRHFMIEVHKNMRLRRVLETVAHEMVHAKQYAKGELYDSTRLAKQRWQGKWVSKNLNYWDMPWEIEAHGREAGLFIQWAEANDLAKYKWTQEVI
jgi:hypothetical protein